MPASSFYARYLKGRDVRVRSCILCKTFLNISTTKWAHTEAQVYKKMAGVSSCGNSREEKQMQAEIKVQRESRNAITHVSLSAIYQHITCETHGGMGALVSDLLLHTQPNICSTYMEQTID